MTGRVSELDLAAKAPCHAIAAITFDWFTGLVIIQCKTVTRYMGSVPIAGSGTNLRFANGSWCNACLRRKLDMAVEAINP